MFNIIFIENIWGLMKIEIEQTVLIFKERLIRLVLQTWTTITEQNGSDRVLGEPGRLVKCSQLNEGCIRK